MRHYSTLLLLLCILAGNRAGAQVPKDYYCNARFGFCIQYDTVSLKRQPEAQNGDGCVFKDGAGQVKLTVSGTGDWNFSADGAVITLAELYKKEQAGFSHITYKMIGKNSFTLSGTDHGQIFYEKAIKREDAFCFALLRYAPAEQDKYSRMAALIAKTFR